MRSLTAIFGPPTDKTGLSDEKLQDLYWNRNQLKKEFAGLRNEKLKLSDRLKAQQGDIARLEQKLKHIEDLLADPEWSRSVMVMYRLRGLNARCTRKVALFAEQAKQQREQKKHGQALATWRARNAEDVAALEAEIRGLRESIFGIEEELQQLLHGLRAVNRFLRFLRRRSVSKRAAAATAKIAALEQQEEQLRADIQAIEAREPPENVGLTQAEKRSINLMIIAYAQELYTQFADDDFVGLVKAAADMSPGAIRYGSDRDCEALLGRMNACEQRLDRTGDVAEALRKRAKLLADRAIYENDSDAVPLPGTMTTLIRFDSNDISRTTDVDLLCNNYWGLANALSR